MKIFVLALFLIVCTKCFAEDIQMAQCGHVQCALVRGVSVCAVSCDDGYIYTMKSMDRIKK